GALPDLADEDRPVAELLTGRVRQDRAQHHVPGPGQVALVPLPVLAHVDDVAALVDELLDLVDLQVAERGLLLCHTYLLLLVEVGQSIGADLQDLEREQRALDAGRGDVDPEHVPAKRVVLLVADVRALETPEVPRVLVVVDDVLAVELIVGGDRGAHAKILCASLIEAASRSTSSFCV